MGQFAIHYREEIRDQGTIDELDDFYTRLNTFLGKGFNPDGTLKIANSSSSSSVQNGDTIMQQIEDSEGHWWKNGPWIFDTDHSHNAIQVSTNLAGTIHNFAYGDIDKAIGLELNLLADTTITGIKAPPQTLRRVLILRNNSSTYTITLRHQNTGSQDINRFALPGGVDIVMGTLQTVWLYYDADNHRWGCFITANTAGGLSGAGGSSSSGDVVGPSSATDGAVALYDGTTGKLIKDSTQTIAQIQAGVSQNIQVVEFDITTKATYMALNSSPKTVIAAPGAGLSIDVLGWSLDYLINLGGGSAFSSGPTLDLRFSGASVSQVSGYSISNPSTGSRYLRFSYQPGSASSNVNDTSTANKALVVRANVDLTGGSNATISFKMVVYYAIRAVIQ